MELKSLLALSALTVSLSAGAQTLQKPVYVRPTLPTPKTTTLDKTGQTAQYLYNVKAQAFLRGANNYMTRATLDDTLGYKFKVVLEDATNQLYSLNDSVLKFKKYLKMFAAGKTDVWVDNNDGLNANNWTITDNADGTFTIGNTGYAGTVLGAVVTDVPESVASLSSTGCSSIGMYVNLAEPSDDLCSTWAAVSEADFDAFIQENKSVFKGNSADPSLYNAQLSLYNALVEAMENYPKADFSSVIAVYNDANSTKDQLAEAQSKIAEVEKAYVDANLEKATLAEPIEITSKIPACDMANITESNSTIDGLWTREFTGTETKGSLRKNTWSVEGKSDGTNMLTPFIENWMYKGTNLSDQICRIDTIDAKPGVYKIIARVRMYNEASDAESISGASLFGNFQQKTIVDQTKEISDKISDGTEGYFTYNSMLGYYAPEATTYAIVGDDGKLTFGISLKGANYNWQAYKDFRVYYLGKAQDAFDVARTTDMFVSKIDEDVLITKSIKDSVNALLDIYQDKTSTPEQIMKAVADYSKFMNDSVAPNKAAWAEYKSLYERSVKLVKFFEERNLDLLPCVLELADYAMFYDINAKEMTLSTEEVNTAKDDMFKEYENANELYAGIDNLTTDSSAVTTGIYSINGSKLSKLTKGVNIVRTADGKVKKMIVK